MSTFVGDNPQTSGEKTGPETVQRPESKPCQGVKRRVGQRQLLRVNESIRVCCSLVNGRNDDEIPHTAYPISLAKKRCFLNTHM